MVLHMTLRSLSFWMFCVVFDTTGANLHVRHYFALSGSIMYISAAFITYIYILKSTTIMENINSGQNC